MGLTTSDTLTMDIFLKRLVKDKSYSLRNIYYDYDKSDIREESKPTLDSLYQILIENPGITIELSSHTDSRGSDTYNQTLSQKRAESCVNYLIAKGIPQSRMTAKGYGESKPVEDCTTQDGCSNESNSEDCPCHQKNRRTEFRILSDVPVEVNYEE
jgi:outer membrane protein OmpA-like peptidoglycan-associated protein